MRPQAGSLIILVGFVWNFVWAQNASAPTCLASYNWMKNSNGQTPCDLVAVLGGTCSNGNWSVDPLTDPTQYYSEPNQKDNTIEPCQCNTLMYTLISACAVCQNGSYSSWTEWTANCPASQTYHTWPYPLPMGLVIPPWAWFDPSTTSDKYWDENFAFAYASSPSASLTPGVTASSTSATTTTLTTTPATSASSSPSTAPDSSTHSKSSVGPVIGGVLGGLLLFLAILALLWYTMRRRITRIVRIVRGNSGDWSLDMDTESHMATGSPAMTMSTLEPLLVTNPFTDDAAAHSSPDDDHTISYIAGSTTGSAPNSAPNSAPTSATATSYQDPFIPNVPPPPYRPREGDSNASSRRTVPSKQ